MQKMESTFCSKRASTTPSTINEGFGKKIEIDIQDDLTASIRDYGRGIPLGSLIPAVSKLNTGGKYDNDQYTASVGLNGVGLKL